MSRALKAWKWCSNRWS